MKNVRFSLQPESDKKHIYFLLLCDTSKARTLVFKNDPDMKFRIHINGFFISEAPEKLQKPILAKKNKQQKWKQVTLNEKKSQG